MKSRKLIIGNWKMNPETLLEARAIFAGIKKQHLQLLFVFFHPAFIARAHGTPFNDVVLAAYFSVGKEKPCVEFGRHVIEVLFQIGRAHV